jgi:hypothetical protein
VEPLDGDSQAGYLASSHPIDQGAAEAPAPSRRRPRRTVVLGVVAGLLVLGAVEFWAYRQPEALPQLTGRIVDPGCHDQLTRGPPVLVSDGDGKVLATTSISEAPIGGRCDRTFSVVVPRSDLYQLQVGSLDRFTWPVSELEAFNWRLRIEVPAAA